MNLKLKLWIPKVVRLLYIFSILSQTSGCFMQKKTSIFNILKPLNQECPLPYKRRRNELCIFVSNNLESFFDARETCHSMEGFLAEPIDKSEKEYIHALLEITAKEKGIESALHAYNEEYKKHLLLTLTEKNKEAQDGKGIESVTHSYDEEYGLYHHLMKQTKPPQFQDTLNEFRFWMGGSFFRMLLKRSCESLNYTSPLWHTDNREIKNWAKEPFDTYCEQCVTLDIENKGLTTDFCDISHLYVCEYNPLHKYGIYSQ